MKYKYLFTDMDNTLFDSVSLYDQAITAAWEHIRKFYDITHKDFKESFLKIRTQVKDKFPGQTIAHSREVIFELLLEKYKIPFNAELILDLYNAYWNTVNIYIQPFPGTIESLEKIKNARITIVAISDGTLLTRLEKIDSLKLSSYIDYLVSSEEVVYTKPNPESFQKALEKSGASKNEVLYVGDNFHRDVVGGVRFGIDTAWITDLSEKLPDDVKLKPSDVKEEPTYQIKSFPEVLGILGIS